MGEVGDSSPLPIPDRCPWSSLLSNEFVSQFLYKVTLSRAYPGNQKRVWSRDAPSLLGVGPEGGMMRLLRQLGSPYSSSEASRHLASPPQLRTGCPSLAGSALSCNFLLRLCHLYSKDSSQDSRKITLNRASACKSKASLFADYCPECARAKIC